MEEKKPIEPPPDLRGLSAYSTQPIDVYIGRTHMRIPWNMIAAGYQTGFLQGGPRKLDGIALIVFWPEMIGSVEGPGRPAFDDLYIQITGFDKPISWSKDPDSGLKERTKTLDGPALNEQTGLREWYLKGTKEAVIFARRDSTYRVPGGPVPFALCPHTAAEVVDCHSGEQVNEYLTVGYRFYKNNIVHWPEIDDAVRSLISSMIVK